jgi:putative glutamine amidotransferase
LLVAGRPVIGVMMDENTSRGGQLYETSKAYFRAISLAGGLPVGLTYDPATPDFAEQTCHGLVVCGGRVRFPDHWYQAGRTSGSPPSERIDVEVALVPRWMATGRPYLGICHGMQVLAATHGAKLSPALRLDVPDALVHDTADACHPVSVVEGSLLHRLTGASVLTVNSLHSEAVMEISASLSVSARAPDGIIEAVEVIGHRFALGVQWHPERLADTGQSHTGQSHTGQTQTGQTQTGQTQTGQSEPQAVRDGAMVLFSALIDAARLGF